MSTTLLAQLGAFRLWNAGELLTYVELNEQNTAAMQTALHLLGRMCIDTNTGDPPSGFVGDDCLPAKGAGDLAYTVEAGLGFQYVSSSSGTWEISYQPVLQAVQATGSVPPHDLTLPRIDLLVIQAGTSDDSAENRSVKDVSTSSVSTQSVNTRRVYSAIIQVVVGTPAASPSRPAVPSDYIEVAEVYVPATSGAITVTDTRPRISLGQDWAPDPPASFAAPHVIDGGFGGDLAVSAGSGLSVEVAAGEMWFEGYRHRHHGEVLALATADPTNPRYDLIICHRNNGLRVITGTPAASPPATIAGVDIANEIILAKVLVPATATTISGGDITDERDLAPYHGDQIQSRQMEVNRLRYPPLKVMLTKGSQAGNDIPVTLDLRDSDGVEMVRPVRRNISGIMTTRLLATVYDDGWERSPSSGTDGMGLGVTSGTAQSTTGKSGLLFDTASDGTASLTVTRSDAAFTGDVYLKVEPIVRDSSDFIGFPSYVKLTFS